MSCNDFRPFLGAYIDDEVDEREAAEFESHLDSCGACRAELETQLRIKRTMQQALGDDAAPEELKERVLAGMSEIDAEREGDEPTSSRSRPLAALAAAIPLMLGVSVILWLMPSLTVAPVESGQPPVVENTVDWHRQAFPVEVPGPDRSHVATWFDGKVEFPVRIPEFKKEGVRLVGGRIAHVQDRRAAYLSYQVNGARMSVMIFHGEGVKVPSSRIREVGGHEVALFNNHGYEVAVLQDGGLTYTLTSELAENELLDVVVSSIETKK